MKKSQFGWIFFAVTITVVGLVFYKNPDYSTIIIVSTISIILLLLFYKLTIIVTDEYVKFSFGIGLIKGKYELSKIEKCRPLRYIPLGWGIRLRPGVILFNVSGNKAIELEIKDKKRKVWIGTSAPDELSEYINSKLDREP